MTIAKISAALVKAQKEFAPALKTSTNPHFKSKYVGLDGCVEAVLDALNNNGIFLMQKTHDCDSGVKVETVLIHESGEEYSGGILHVPAAKNDPQGYGSALTYCRRYSLMAACGIAPEDDDGNAATTAYKAQPKQSSQDNYDANGKVKPGNVTPSLAQQEWDKMDEQSKVFLTEIAVEVITAFNDGNIEKAHRLVYLNDLDSDEVIALWSRLESKMRTAIKEHDKKLKAPPLTTEQQLNGTMPQ